MHQCLLVSYIPKHASSFFDVVYTQVHCLPTHYDTMLSQHCHNTVVYVITIDSTLAPYVLCVSVPYVKLREHTYPYCSCCGTSALFSYQLWGVMLCI